MVKQFALALALLAGLAFFGAPRAEAASPLKLSQTVEIAASPDKVWSIIRNFSDMSWHPAIKSSSATNGNTVGSVRTLDLGGPKLIEALVRYNDAKMSYTYRITDDPANVKTLPVTKYRSTIIVQKSGTGSSVTWRGTFERADPAAKPADGQDDATATKAVTGVYRGGLDNLKKLAEAH